MQAWVGSRGPGDLWEIASDLNLLAGVDASTRAEILEEAQLRELDCGDVLIKQGAQNRRMYLVLEGQLGVFLQALATEPVAVVKAGQSVGELSVLDQRPASANVIALEACRVIALSEAAFWRLITASHGFAVSLLQQLAERMRSNNEAFTRTAQERSEYERAAMYDGLTGVYNRRWADASIEQLAAKNGAFSVVLLDVDHFKRFNDHFGHAAGDFVLTKVAALLTRTLRGTDFVARYGGEEFVLVLPDASAEAAAMVAERVRRALAAVSFEMRDGTDLPPVTISAGVAAHAVGESAADLVKRADAALYRAKDTGRNRVERA